MTDAETLRVYDQRARDYAAAFSRETIDPDLTGFMAHLPVKARVLDLGCGPGTAAAIMVERGFLVDAIDASAEMVKLAKELHDLDVRQAGFDDIEAQPVYDGIWANFSLLHAPRKDVPLHVERLANAMRPGGYFHLGMKLGSGERRDSLGRFYCFFEAKELQSMLENVGLSLVAQSTGKDAGLAGTVDPWITILACKKGTARSIAGNR